MENDFTVESHDVEINANSYFNNVGVLQYGSLKIMNSISIYVSGNWVLDQSITKDVFDPGTGTVIFNDYTVIESVQSELDIYNFYNIKIDYYLVFFELL